jgi:hypothetical protein
MILGCLLCIKGAAPGQELIPGVYHRLVPLIHKSYSVSSNGWWITQSKALEKSNNKTQDSSLLSRSDNILLIAWQVAVVVYLDFQKPF